MSFLLCAWVCGSFGSISRNSVKRLYYQQIAVISAKEISELQEIRERSVLQV